MIELAPHHKQGLQIQNPIMIGGGFAGYGESLHAGINPNMLGAIVVGPFLRYSSGGSDRPRIAEDDSSFVLNTGWQNRGISRTLKKYSPLWSRLGCPIIPQVADSNSELLLDVIDKLNNAFYQGTSISAVELVIPRGADEGMAEQLTMTVLRSTDLPLIINLPLLSAVDLAPTVVYAGADALVIGRSPQGMLFRYGAPIIETPTHSGTPPEMIPLRGTIGGNGIFPLMVDKLHEVYELDLDVPLIAAGGIHSVGQARQVLKAGAKALQIESVLWVEPEIIPQLVEGVLTLE